MTSQRSNGKRLLMVIGLDVGANRDGCGVLKRLDNTPPDHVGRSWSQRSSQPHGHRVTLSAE